MTGRFLECAVGEARGWVLPVSSALKHFEHLLIAIREGAPHKQAKAIFPNGSCRTIQITAPLCENKTPEASPIPPTSPA